MKKFLFLFAMASLSPTWSLAQLDALPDSPLDSSMGNAAGGTTATLNQLNQKSDRDLSRTIQREEQEEDSGLDEYVEPTDSEFNRNYDPEAITPGVE